MTSMHPHWESTEDEHVVPIRSKNDERRPIRVSRAPAAAVGIALMVGAVSYAYGGLGDLIGQLTNPTPDVTVNLKQDGPDPTPATIKPGQTIRWVNDDQIPHVLTSTTLPTSDGKPFSTPSMFPNDDAFYTAPASATEGSYDYISQTSPDFSGQIVITTASATPSSASSAAVAAASSSPVVTQPPAAPAVPLPTQQSSSIAPNPVGANVIAVNPHVVGAKSSSSKKPGVIEHRPSKQTETGPGVWIVLGCSVAALYVGTRGAFRKV